MRFTLNVYFLLFYKSIFSKVINVNGKATRGDYSVGLALALIERLAIKAIKTVLSAPRDKLSTHQSRGGDYRNLMLIVMNLPDIG
jgi:hypothetical protein